MNDRRVADAQKAGKWGGIGVCLAIISLLIGVIAYLLGPILFKPSIFGFKVVFEDCQVFLRDSDTGERILTNETIKIHEVDYGVKFVEAETMEGGIFGLGFIHAKDRLW